MATPDPLLLDSTRTAYPHQMQKRRLIGILIGLAGLALIVIALIADHVGLSSGGPANTFGRTQWLVAGAGALLVVVGGVVAFFRRS